MVYVVIYSNRILNSWKHSKNPWIDILFLQEILTIECWSISSRALILRIPAFEEMSGNDFSMTWSERGAKKGETASSLFCRFSFSSSCTISPHDLFSPLLTTDRTMVPYSVLYTFYNMCACIGTGYGESRCSIKALLKIVSQYSVRTEKYSALYNICCHFRTILSIS